MIRQIFLLVIFIITIVTGGLPGRKFRIMGGFYAKDGQIPFQAAYFVDNVPTCGAVIISTTVVMTAAHCIKSSYKNSSILAGTVNIDLSLQSNGFSRSIVKTVVHEDYDNYPGDYHNDIALLFLDRPLEYGKYVQAAVLPTKDEDYQNSNADVIVSGWGVDRDYGGSRSSLLKFTNLQLIPRDICLNEGGSSRTNVICAGSEDGSTDSCGGDSGGPLFIGKKVIGLVSFGFPCGFAPGPGTYTDIAKLREWIRKQSGV